MENFENFYWKKNCQKKLVEKQFLSEKKFYWEKILLEKYLSEKKTCWENNFCKKKIYWKKKIIRIFFYQKVVGVTSMT